MAVVYRRSHDIEKRLEEMLRLIRAGSYATPALAKILGVSIPTVSRCVNALRERGHGIRAEKHADGWRYVLGDAKKACKRKHVNPHDLATDIKRQIQLPLSNQDEAHHDRAAGTPTVPHKTAGARDQLHEAGNQQRQVSFR